MSIVNTVVAIAAVIIMSVCLILILVSAVIQFAAWIRERRERKKETKE